MTAVPAVRPRRRWVLPVAVLLQLLVLPPYAASGLLAPAWGVVLLLTVWALLLGLLVVLGRAGRLTALLCPLAAVSLWFLLVSAGAAWLGWTT